MGEYPSALNTPNLSSNLPLYPPLIQLLRVTAATVTGPAGVAQTAGSSVLGPTLYVAFVQQLRTDALLPRDREPCLADDVRGGGLTPGFHLGRLAGSHNGLPVYEIVEIPTVASTDANTIGCRITHGNSQTVGAGATATLNFNGEDYDTDSMHSTTVNNSRITFNTAGKYIIWFYCLVSYPSVVPSANVPVEALVAAAGAIPIRDIRLAPLVSSADIALHIMFEAHFPQGEFIEVTVTNNETVNSISVSDQVFGARRQAA